jgi:hypothetical protein
MYAAAACGGSSFIVRLSLAFFVKVFVDMYHRSCLVMISSRGS